MVSKINNEYDLQTRLIDLLISERYPEESFIIDWKQGDNTYSLAISDPKTKAVLAVFELLISSPVIVTTADIREKIEKYRSLISDIKLPLYIVSAIQSQDSFSISKILYQTKNSNTPHFIQVSSLPSFEELKKKVLSSNMSNDFSQMTDEELEGIIRLHENSDISGSRFQRAMTELDLRYRKRGYQPSTQIIHGDYIGRDKVTKGEGTNKKLLWKRPEIIIGLLALFVAMIAIPYWPQWYQLLSHSDLNNASVSMNQIMATSTINIADILAEYKAKKTSLEKRDFLQTYRDTSIQGLGSFVDRDKPNEKYLITLRVSGDLVSCFFNTDSETEKKLLLLKEGQDISFSGTFTTMGVFGGGWDVKNCILSK